MSERNITGYASLSTEQIEDIMRNARRERAEAISQLFGFGFGAVKKALVGEKRADVADAAAAKPAAGCA